MQMLPSDAAAQEGEEGGGKGEQWPKEGLSAKMALPPRPPLLPHGGFEPPFSDTPDCRADLQGGMV
jgi:hypothetical protein